MWCVAHINCRHAPIASTMEIVNKGVNNYECKGLSGGSPETVSGRLSSLLYLLVAQWVGRSKQSSALYMDGMLHHYMYHIWHNALGLYAACTVCKCSRFWERNLLLGHNMPNQRVKLIVSIMYTYKVNVNWKTYLPSCFSIVSQMPPLSPTVGTGTLQSSLLGGGWNCTAQPISDCVLDTHELVLINKNKNFDQLPSLNHAAAS